MRQPPRSRQFTLSHREQTLATIFRYGSAQDQEGDLHLPQADHPPVVCLLHGGFWRMPYGRDQLDGIARDLVARGFAVWNIEYRRLGAPGGGWPGTLADVALAIDHLDTLVADGIDLDLGRVIVAGHSAGGQLALWASARRRPPGVHGPTRVHPIAAAGLAAVVDLAGAHAISCGDSAVEAFLGGPSNRFDERIAAASPMALLPLGVDQLIVHGASDAALPVAMARRYAAAAIDAGDRVEFVELPDAGHMDFLDPASVAHAAFCGWLARYSNR
jgi:acetyl esterase/lipase